MSITSRYRCKTCDFAVVVEGETSSDVAIAEYMNHLTENHAHVMGSPETVWTDNPYIPPEQ